MRVLLAFVLLVVVASLGDARSFSFSKRVVMEKDLPAAHPTSWTLTHRVDQNRRITLLFALSQQNLDGTLHSASSILHMKCRRSKIQNWTDSSGRYPIRNPHATGNILP